MDMTRAIEHLILLWMRDIGASTRSPPGLFHGRMHLLETLVIQLAASPPERWFEALPASGKARGYYLDIVLPLQRASHWEDSRILVHLKSHIIELRERWFWGLYEEMRSQGKRERAPSTWEQTLFDLELSELLDLGPGYISPRQSEDRVLYFAFVEDVETIPAGQRQYVASGDLAGEPLAGVDLEHVRFSAILVDQFLALAPQVDPVDPDNAGFEQRSRRKEQLQRVLEGVALPVFDLFIHPDAKAALGIEPAFGDWYLLGYASASDEEGFSIYVTDPEDGERPTTTRADLGLLAQAPEFLQNRLRDIFSLVHIPDADFGEIERGDGTPVPNNPITPRFEEAGLEDEERAREAEPPAVYRSAN